MFQKTLAMCAVGVVVVVSQVTNVKAALVDDFEGYGLGTDIHNQGNWTVDEGKGTVVADPHDATNQVLLTETDGDFRRLFVGLGINSIAANEDSKIVTFRGMWGGDQDVWIGLTQEDPTTLSSAFGAFATQVGKNGAQFTVRDGGGTQDIGSVSSNVWYDISMAISHTEQTYDVVVSGGDLTTALTISGANFRNTSFTELAALQIVSSAAATDNFWIDNIQVVPEPASMALMGLGVVFMLRRRNKTA